MSEVAYKDKLIYSIQQAKQNLFTFCLLIYPPVVTTFIWSKLHIFLMNQVQSVYDGTTNKKQTVSVPPQHGKSQVLSKIAVAWMLGARPGITIAITGFSHTLVTKFSKEVKSIVSSKMYQLIFPGTNQVYGSDKAEEWELTNGSCLIAKSAGSKLTGRRVDWLIIDDPHAGREEAESVTMRKKIQQWYFADCVTRLSPGAAVFVIATRWHPEDLIGYLTSDEYIQEIKSSGITNIEEELFEVTNIPAICDNEETDPLGRKLGEAAFPEVRTKEFLDGIKATIPAYEWRSQYQGVPRSSGSGQADIDKIRYCDYKDVPGPDKAIWIRGWDLAISEEQTSDYTAGPLIVFEKEQRILYLVEMFRKRQAWVKLKDTMIETVEMDIQREVHAEGIEAVAGFGAIYSDIKNHFLGRMKIVKRNPKRCGKLIRATWWFNLIEKGSFVVVRAPWNKDFIDELSTFPDGNNDDQVDGISVGTEVIPKKYRQTKKVRKDELSGDGSKRPSIVVRPKQRTRVLEV
jgi:predicted phage terminase large subunit-like protein